MKTQITLLGVILFFLIGCEHSMEVVEDNSMFSTEIQSASISSTLEATYSFCNIIGKTQQTQISTWAYSSTLGTPQTIRNLSGTRLYGDISLRIRVTLHNTSSSSITVSAPIVESNPFGGASNMEASLYETTGSALGDKVTSITIPAGQSVFVFFVAEYANIDYTFPDPGYGWATARTPVSVTSTVGSGTLPNSNNYILAWQ